jgi:hypothetical protein
LRRGGGCLKGGEMWGLEEENIACAPSELVDRGGHCHLVRIMTLAFRLGG